MLEHCLEIHRLESLCDTVFRSAIAAMFQQETDAILIMKLNEVYQTLETTTDRFADLAVALRDVMFKHV